MPDDPFSRLGLRPVRLGDRAVLEPYFASLDCPLSDYTFSQLYTWAGSLQIRWTLLRNHLCVFAGGNDLTLLMPPLGDTGGPAALAEAVELMDEYNRRQGAAGQTRVEYVSEELLGRFDPARLDVEPLGADYLYDVRRMIDLAGSDLASKRQAKNRFLRLYEHRVEPYDATKHLGECVALLDRWKDFQDTRHTQAADAGVTAVKRQQESTSARVCIEAAAEMGLEGIVVYVKDRAEGSGFEAAGSGGDGGAPCPSSSPSSLNPEPRTPNPPGWSLRGFTFGERLGSDQNCIAIEKTDLGTKGLAQFIFSEFCRSHWADRPLVNVGDDWGLETLAWTKQSYRPVKLLQKYVLRPRPACAVAVAPPQRVAPELVIRRARPEDMPAARELEVACFGEGNPFCVSERQLKYLHRRPSVVFLVAEQGGRVVGDGIALVRQHRSGPSGRVYSLAVDPGSRGQKIGRRVLGAMIDTLKARGVRRVYLEVEQENESAIALYQGFGFRQTRTLTDYYGPGRHAQHMLYTVPQALAA